MPTDMRGAVAAARPTLRQEVAAKLPTDSDLDAFCAEQFAEVAARFSNGQDRLAKINLLLALTDEAMLRSALAAYSPKTVLAAMPQRRPPRSALPSLAALRARSLSLLDADEAEFEHPIDLALNIRQVPQLVRAQHAPHSGARELGAARPLQAELLEYVVRTERLLLVGMPGSGKTQTLRTLCRQMLAAASNLPEQPVPFIINLSTFSKYRGSFSNWLAEGLKESSGISLSTAQALLQEGMIFVLLDGLDEMASDRRPSALNEINALLSSTDPRLAHCVVCSRTLEYQNSGILLLMPMALELLPLSREQVTHAIARAGSQADPLRRAIARDESLETVLETPLLISIAMQAFADTPELSLAGRSADALRQLLYDAYVVRMMRRTRIKSGPPPAQTLIWLRWLARYLGRERSSLFLIERLQPTALNQEGPYRLASQRAWWLSIWLAVWLGVALVRGLDAGLDLQLVPRLLAGVAPLASSYWYMALRALLGPWLSRLLLCGMLVDFVLSLVMRSALPPVRTIQPVEDLHWSFRRALENSLALLRFEWKLGAFYTVLIFALSFLLSAGLCLLLKFPIVICGIVGSIIMLGFGINATAVWGIIVFIFCGWTNTVHEQTAQPNQGIRSSLINGLRAFLIIGMFIGSIEALIVSFLFDRVTGTLSGLGVATVCGFTGGLIGGFGQALHHYILRALIWHEGNLPLRLENWLESCRSQLLLRRQGGTYRFFHKTMQDYFSTLDDHRMKDLAHRIESKTDYSPHY